ncbi:MAG: MFS transporter [Candidatus Korarchaeota archaeon]|nr:MFS transporter [Candidatus Korarchaeota archaeon]
MGLTGRERNVVVIALSWTMMRPFGAATRTYFALYFLELGADPARIGLITMAGSLTLAISKLLGGYLADAVGRKRLIVSMTAVYAFASLLYALARDWTWILAAEVISSATLLYQPAIAAILADSLPSEIRGRGISAARTAATLSSLAGPPLAAFLVGRMDLVPAVRLLYAARSAAVLAAAVVRMTLTETLRLEERRPISLRSILEDYRRAVIWLKGDLGRLIAVNSAAMGSHSLAEPFIQIFAVKEIGIDPELWGLISTVVRAEILASINLSGYIADKLGRNISLALGYGSGAAGMLMLLMSPPGSGAWVLVSQLVYAAFASWPARFALFADLTPAETRGRLTAVRGLVENLSSSAASAAGGVLYSISPIADLGLASVGLTLTALAALRILPKVGRLPDRATAEISDLEPAVVPGSASNLEPPSSP